MRRLVRLIQMHDSNRKSNFESYGIDFADAVWIFQNPILRSRSDRGQEKRFVAIGMLDDIEIAFDYTVKRCGVPDYFGAPSEDQ